ncbi:phage minor capsid protein [Streptomyces sp. NPDC057253]|uniref:phage minor capsid protein n=1 Tax=Streptomyces sp. NPDC057253 TaxID=3346069 RepID=UPI0036445CE4
MPVSPAMAEDLAREVGLLYQDAEAALLERLAAALEADIESPRWAELKLAAIGNLRTAVESVADALQRDTDGAVRRALVEAYNRGRQAAVAELGALDIGRELVARQTVPNAPAVDRLAASLARDTRPVYARITRVVMDVYQRITGRASGNVLLGTVTRRQASQRALDQFAARGVTGFVDRSGRSWDMASYAEMAVRSVTARAAIEGHVDALGEIGVGLVMVSDAPLECPLCAKWEGEVLTLSGQSGPHTVRAEHVAPPEQPRRGLLRRRGPAPTVAVHVAGSLLEARAAGLFHPNCRHSLSAYLPGVSTRPPHHATPGTTYADTQRQREIERHIRRWKRTAAAAMDDDARRKANAKVRQWQAAMREHVAAHEHLRRKPQREQINSAR